MRLLLCADVRLAASCTENLDVKLAHKWQTARNEKLAELVDLAAQNNAAYIALFGSMFGRERVSESVIDSLFSAINEDKHIHVLTFLSADEFNRINYRNDLPDNLHLICMQTPDTYTDDNIALRINKGCVEIQLADNAPIYIKRSSNGSYCINGIGKERAIPSFEPIGFEDAEGQRFGYGVIEWTNESLCGYTTVKMQRYAYKSVDLKILPSDGEKDIVRKISKATKAIDSDSFLRLTLVGSSAFGLTLNANALEEKLKNKIFFVEVYDNTIMSIDEEAFENDISLRSEFVRLALQDDSLSESERNRLISCGWNALNGGEVSEE